MTRRSGGCTAAWLGLVAGPVLAAGLACGRQPQTESVAMKDVAFRPDSISAAVGDTVVFRNEDPVPHTATSDRGAFDSGDVRPDGTWRWVAGAKGRFPYHCTYHPNMTGVITVR